MGIRIIKFFFKLSVVEKAIYSDTFLTKKFREINIFS